MPEFETLEELLAWIKENAKEVDGKFVVPAVVELAKNFEKATAAKKEAIEARKKVSAQCDALEKELAENKSKLDEVNSQIESLQKSGTPDERYQTLANEKAGLEKEMKRLKETVSSYSEKDKLLETLQVQVRDFETKEKNSKIWDALQKEAKTLGIPATVIDCDLKRFVGDFDLDDDGEIVQRNDAQKTVKTSLAEWQKERPHWQAVSAGAGAGPGGSAGGGSSKSLSVGEIFLANPISTPN